MSFTPALRHVRKPNQAEDRRKRMARLTTRQAEAILIRNRLAGDWTMATLRSKKAIDKALSSGDPLGVVGLNGRGLVQFQLPPGNDYIVMTAEQARELAAMLCKHADSAESEYWKAVRTGKKPKIWPPITMTREELEHFRQTHGGGPR